MSINRSPSAMLVASAYYNPPIDSLQHDSSQEQPNRIISIFRDCLSDMSPHRFSRTEKIIREHLVDIITERPSFLGLPTTIIFEFSRYLDEKSAGNFNVVAKLNRKKAIERKKAFAQKEIDKIKESEECRKIFPQIVGTLVTSPALELGSIKARLREVITNLKIAAAQIEFVDELVTELEKQFPDDETLTSIKASISSLKSKKIEDANAINAAIVSHLNSNPSLRKAAESLYLSNTELKTMSSYTSRLSNMEVLKLDFSIESTKSIISFVEGIKKPLIIAHDQIHFADVLIAELESRFPNDETLNQIKTSIEAIKNSKMSLVDKVDAINEAIVSHLNSDVSVNPLKNRVEFLNLSNEKLKAILPCIGEFPNLTGLDLSNNQLVEIPECISRLMNLKDLAIFDNRLVRLPESIGGLINLGQIFLCNNRLVRLPETIGKLINLKLLYLSNNRLVELPETIDGLINLRQLVLSNNRLVGLPEGIGKLINLGYLELKNNQLVKLPESIGGLINLSYLDLRNNQLIELPGGYCLGLLIY